MDPEKARALTNQLRRLDRAIEELRDELDDVRAQLKKSAKPAPAPEDDE